MSCFDPHNRVDGFSSLPEEVAAQAAFSQNHLSVPKWRVTLHACMMASKWAFTSVWTCIARYGWWIRRKTWKENKAKSACIKAILQAHSFVKPLFLKLCRGLGTHISSHIGTEKKADTLTSSSPTLSQSLNQFPLHHWISTSKEFSTTFSNFYCRT